MTPDGIFAVGALIVGLAIGLVQLYIGQRQFEIQQRSTFDEIRISLSSIKERLGILEARSSDQSFNLQMQMLSMVRKEHEIEERTEETGEEIKELISTTLRDAGVTDVNEKISKLDAKVEQIAIYAVQGTANAVRIKEQAHSNYSLKRLNRALRDEEFIARSQDIHAFYKFVVERYPDGLPVPNAILQELAKEFVYITTNDFS